MPAADDRRGLSDMTQNQHESTALTDPDAVFEEYRVRIYHYALRLVSDPAEAEDLTQDTFLRAHDRLGGLRDPAALKTWLFRIATNLARDRYRRRAVRGRSPVSLDSPPLDGSPPAGDAITDEDAPRIDEAMEREELSTCVQEYIEALPDSYRAVILLKDLQGLTNPEIAEMLECSLPTVKIRLHRARTRLKAALEAGCNLDTGTRGTVGCEPKSLK
jgi:RNA polymerase sigma-70 factor (ECF subfamily)